jgi:lambda family phage portal protein
VSDGSQVLHAWLASRPGAAVRLGSAPLARSRAPRRLAREFAGGTSRPITASWTTQDRHVNQSLLQHLRVLRARSRDLERNNDYAKHFLRLVTDNVVGPSGMSLQVQAKRPDGKLDSLDSDACEQAFARWSRAANCDVARRLSFTALQRLIVRQVARDGEVLIRRWPRGPFNYQLQLLDPALLNENYNDELASGNRVRMGVEVNSFDEPVAYYLLKRESQDPRTGLSYTQGDYVRVLASEMWHLFVPEFTGQYRGVPWMSTTLIRQKRLSSFEEAALGAAEEGAKKLAWIKSPDGDIAPLADGSSNTDGSATDDINSGTLSTDSFDVAYGHLPPGYDVESWDPKYPEAYFGAFVKATLRGIGAGLGVAYHKLGNDLEGVNYSSARSGELNERDVWKALQVWLIDSFCAPVYSEWLPNAILTGELALPMSKKDKFDAAVWQGRRWDWVDPEKDVNANVTAIDNCLTSRRRVIAAMGNDPDEIFAELREEKQQLADLLPDKAPPAAPGAPAPQQGAQAA